MVGHRNWYTISPYNEDFKFTMNPYPLEPMVFHDAADWTAKQMAKDYDNLVLCLSGGQDSRYVAETFLRNNVKFTPAIVRHDANTEETDRAIAWCKENKITPLVHEMTSDAYVRYCFHKNFKYQNHSHWSCYPLIVAELVADQNGHVVTGYEDPFENDGKKLSKDIVVEKYSMLLHYERVDQPGAFFMYTPELMLSMINYIDYEMEQSAAKSKLYGFDPEPKLVADNDIFKDQETLCNISMMRVGELKTKDVLGPKDSVIKFFTARP